MDQNGFIPLVLLTASLDGMAAYMVAQMANTKGKATLYTCLTLGLISTAVLGAFTSSAAGCQSRWVGSLLSAGFFGLFVTTLITWQQRELGQLKLMAPKVVSLGMRHFNVLSSREHKVITARVLQSAKYEYDWSTEEREVLEYMQKHICEIGHELQIPRTRTGGSIIRARRRAIQPYLCTICGISKTDLRSYEKRLASKYSSW